MSSCHAKILAREKYKMNSSDSDNAIASSPPYDPFDDDNENTLDKIACIQDMINRMEEGPNSSEVFLQNIINQVNKGDVVRTVDKQKNMLTRFEKTNEMLVNFNALSRSRYEATKQEFAQHTQLLMEMKSDLDSVFKRVRTLKQKLEAQHPNAFKVTTESVQRQTVDEEEEPPTPTPQRVNAPLTVITEPQSPEPRMTTSGTAELIDGEA